MTNERYKILNICSWYPNELKPTLGNFVQKHAEVISRLNHNIVIAIFPSTDLKKIKITRNNRNTLTEIIVYYPKRTKGLGVFRIIRNYYHHYLAFKKAYGIVRDEFGKPDIVHLNIVYPLGIWAFWLKKRYKIPYVITENSSGFHLKSEHAYPKSVLRICKKILKNADYILPVSANLRDNLRLLAPSKKYKMISNVVDENLFELREKLKNNHTLRLIHISTGVDEIKNLSGIVNVMNKLFSENLSIQLDIVSDGDIEYAREKVTSLSLTEKILFHSTKSTVEIAEMISKSDALLMFSNYENFPCVIAESLMSGKPVISSNVNGIPEHVNQENGILVNPGDEEALAMAIKSFYSKEKLFSPKVIREYAESKFGYASVSLQFQKVYNELLKV